MSPGKASGEVLVTWARGDAHHGFIVQHASDPTNVATLSTPMPWTKTRFTLGGVGPRLLRGAFFSMGGHRTGGIEERR